MVKKKLQYNKNVLSDRRQTTSLVLPEVDSSQRPLNVSELAQLIGWTRSKIDRYVKLGFIPAHRIGKSCKFFYIDEVLDALKTNTVVKIGTEDDSTKQS